MGDNLDYKFSLREQWIGHKKAREQLLLNAIKTTDGWIGAISDPDYQDIGQTFLELLKLSGCQQEIDIYSQNIAHYVSFSFAHQTGFSNKIVYGPSAEEDLSKLFSSKVHEATHALQKMRSAALHASPFNPNIQIVICPRDWILLEQRCEEDAFVKQAWFNSLLAKSLPEVRRMTDMDPLSVKTFERIRLNTPSLEEALIQTAREALAKSYYSDDPHSEFRFRNSYHLSAIKNYTAGMKLHKDNKDIIFVTAEAEDIYAIGSSCGPNSFGMLPEFLEKPKLNADAQEKLKALEDELKIDNEKLPSLGDILKRLGRTREDFIGSSYNQPLVFDQTRPHIPTP